jgi:hypothetical protein
MFLVESLFKSILHRKEAVMLRMQKIVPFAVAGMSFAGIALLLAPKIRKRKGQKNMPKEEEKAGGPSDTGLYCDVPEGADICYPK